MMRRITFTAGALALAASFAAITEAYVTYAKWSASSVDYYINPSNQDVGALAAEAVSEAILRGVPAAAGIPGYPAAADMR